MRYQIVEDEDEVFDSISDVVDWCIVDDWHSDDDYFEDWVNDNYSGTRINGYDYSAYDIIANVDDGNWTELKDQYCEVCNDEDRDNATRELERAEPGDEIEIQGYNVRVIADDDETEDYDGDALIESVRARIEVEKQIVVEVTEEEKKTEDDIMKLIQVIG